MQVRLRGLPQLLVPLGSIVHLWYTAQAAGLHILVCVCIGPPLPLEQFNHYALVLDIDGNAWSDRYRLLSHFNTPVLKQASNLSAFFEHVMAAGTVVEQYAHDLSDLPVKARALLQELQQSPTRLTRMAGKSPNCRHILEPFYRGS